MRRFSKWAIIAVFALAAIWSALWFYARGMVREQVDQVLAANADSDPAVICNDRTIGGYPFRLTLTCSPAGIVVRSGNISADLGGLNIVALAYNPQHVVAEYSAPLSLALPVSGPPVRADWSRGRSSVIISGQSFERFSTVFENLAVTGPQISLKTTETQFHARPAEVIPVTDLALSADNALFAIDGQTTAPFSLAMTLQVNATPQSFLAGAFDDQGPVLQNINMQVSTGKSRITATGNLSISATGVANGEIVFTAKNLKDLAAFLQTLPDLMRTPAQQTVGSLIALGRPGTDQNGEPVSELTVTIRNNEIFAGDRLITILGSGS